MYLIYIYNYYFFYEADSCCPSGMLNTGLKSQLCEGTQQLCSWEVLAGSREGQ